jgi:pimeloyl-ACP methyl ester carboxylesterase
MDVLRTPESRFEQLSGYPFAPHYVYVAARDTQPLRMHHVDEGPADGSPIVLPHGEPTRSYPCQTMIPPLAHGGHRVLAPGLIGVGRSDKAGVRAGYDAPFPDKRFQAGARAFPRLVPTSPDDPAIPANRAAWEALGRCLFANLQLLDGNCTHRGAQQWPINR